MINLEEIAIRIAAKKAKPSGIPVKYKGINFKPPERVQGAAQRGLDWRSKYGRGGTEIGIARARDLSNGVQISPRTARRMKAFFDRHIKNKDGELDNGQPSNGKIAWALWGGSSGYAWAKSLVNQMNEADEREKNKRKKS